MAGVATEEPGVGRSEEGILSAQSSQSGEALAEWRSSEQVEKGTPSTSPPYWDPDDHDDDEDGPKPSELYGKHTWTIDKFSQINKRELRSDVFDAGGYKWYILIYPQGCDVCNHLSLFLCVHNHDKLLPGWSHFAQFTIAVVNKDPKKSKYSDTLHRFWKKEHDWGWKKFMELSKVFDGFIDADTLIIKAQVQVIREKADRPFRCLDSQYRRELVRVYLTNVEQICRRFVEERRGKLGKLIEDKARWSGFCAFWLGIDQNARCRMSKEKMDVILKVVVKHFFIEKEVTSTLVMDSLYSGLKALEGQSKCKKGRTKVLDPDEMPAPIVSVDKDMFVLVDDVLLLLERAALEPLPPKDEKGPQNRTKDGNSGEDFNKDSIERDERRLTELGRRTVEIFVLAHIFSNKIEAAYQEAVALKRQEELIREEEEAWVAGSEQKSRRGANLKEKKSKKKQAKQKRLNRKAKDKERDERHSATAQDKHEEENTVDEKEVFISEDVIPVLGKPDVLEDVSDTSDLVDGVGEVIQPDSDERDASPVNWDTDASEVHPPTEASSSGVSGLSPVQNGIVEKRSPSMMDDSSSTCSTDSVPSVGVSGPNKRNSFSSNHKHQRSPSRGKSQKGKETRDLSSWTNKTENESAEPAVDMGESCNIPSIKVADTEVEADALSFRYQLRQSEPDVVKKQGEAVSLQRGSSIKQVDEEKTSKEKSIAAESSSSSPRNTSPPRNTISNAQSEPAQKIIPFGDPSSMRKTSLNGKQENDKIPLPTISSQTATLSKFETQRDVIPKTTEKPILPVPGMSRPSSAPLGPGTRPNAPAASLVQTAPLLARSVSAVGRLAPESTSVSPSQVPLSYRNAIIGNSSASTSAVFTNQCSPSSVGKVSAYMPSTTLASSFLNPSTDSLDYGAPKLGFPFRPMNRDVLSNGPQWLENLDGQSIRSDHPLQSDVQNMECYRSSQSRSRDHFTDFQACTSGRQTQGLLADEFPHLDIINDLLDDEQAVGKVTRSDAGFQSLHSRSLPLHRQFSFPHDLGISGDVESTASSCSSFERSRSYRENGIQPAFGSFPGSFDSTTGFIPQVSSLTHANGQMDGLIQNQWHVARSDLSMLGMKNPEHDGYPYYAPDYSDLACGVNGYKAFRPPNGHWNGKE
ncbi:TNF receptor-associated factor homolog 1a-like isoform X3 [Rhodamnia argentea]|uniref:TNF receptor-associated factor homolog 1a-like isoform X3 n=1 Tax=Rhodamnia argentea TaxID=178133 RepID=A0ABM3H1Z4_9MYRT|nr:TNF receptor-associated factor homolog 1a-like isoform X3 [Rhodamnia argentea]